MITKPNSDLVKRQLHAFRCDARYRDADQAVEVVFRQWPGNRNIHEVLAKTTLLNRLYSTNILAVHDVAEHIVEQNIDEQLSCGDMEVVRKIADVNIGGKLRHFRSFASKYCHWHQPDRYQIYDSYVGKILWRYQGDFDFARFQQNDLKDYRRFVVVVDSLVNHFDLHEFSRKEIDIFLWMEGRQLAAVHRG